MLDEELKINLSKACFCHCSCVLSHRNMVGTAALVGAVEAASIFCYSGAIDRVGSYDGEIYVQGRF